MATILSDNCGTAITLPPGFTTLQVDDSDPENHVFAFRSPLGRLWMIGVPKPGPGVSVLPTVLARLSAYAAMLPTPLETL